MKRFLISMSLLLVVASAFAAEALRPEIRSIVEKALSNEREAVTRYEAFAVKADEEGYPGAAALFRAQARAEAVHARRFARLLEASGHPVPEANPPQPNIGGTGDNLRAAAAAEASERDGMYREAFEVCNEHGNPALAKVFDQTRDAEIEHGNLCMAAARNLVSMKEGKTFYVCDACGYTTDVKLPLCASCRHREPPQAVK